MENPNISQSPIDFFDPVAEAHLLETTRWTKFLAIIGCIVMGLMILSFLFVFMTGTKIAGVNYVEGLGVVGIAVIYIFVVSLYIYPIYALLKFSKNIKNGIKTKNQYLVNEGFRYQKNMYRYIGTLTIIIIGFYILVFLLSSIFSLL